MITGPHGGWLVASPSQRGSLHDRTGLPNQDAFGTEPVGDPNPGLVTAVADGHGGSAYVRSDRGAQLAVRVASELALDAMSGLTSPRDDETTRAYALRELAPRIVAAWRAAVTADLAAHPLDSDEAQRAATAGDDPHYAYGATLILAVLTRHIRFVLQLGDGDALTIDAHGRAAAPVPGDARLIGGQTTSLCLADAAADFRFAPLPGDTEIVVLATDGYGNSFADADWRSTVGRDLHETIRTRGFALVGDSLSEWLIESARVGGDDVTVTVIARDAAQQPSHIAGAAREAGVPEANMSSLLRSGRAIGLAALVLALGGGTAAALALRSDDAGEPLVTTATPATTTVPGAVATTIAITTTVTRTTTTASTTPFTTTIDGVSIGPRISVNIAGTGEAIEFATTGTEPSARRLPSTGGGQSFVPTVKIGETEWLVNENGSLRRNGEPVPLLDPSNGPISARGLVALEDGSLWVLSTDVRWLLRVGDDRQVTRFAIAPPAN